MTTLKRSELDYIRKTFPRTHRVVESCSKRMLFCELLGYLEVRHNNLMRLVGAGIFVVVLEILILALNMQVSTMNVLTIIGLQALLLLCCVVAASLPLFYDDYPREAGSEIGRSIRAITYCLTRIPERPEKELLVRYFEQYGLYKDNKDVLAPEDMDRDLRGMLAEFVERFKVSH